MAPKDDETKRDVVKYNLDVVIKLCVEDIWMNNADQDGLMEKQQVWMFVRTLLADMGDYTEFSDRDFEECYR